jgi:hypothetical protein
MGTLERLLAEAAADEALREELLADRLGAAQRRGYTLGPDEQAALEAVPAAQLRTLIDGLSRQVGPASAEVDGGMASMPVTGIRPDGPSPVKGIRPGRVVLAAAAVTTVGAAIGGAVCVSAGVRPDVPGVVKPVQRQEVVAPAQEAVSDAGPEGGAEHDKQ